MDAQLRAQFEGRQTAAPYRACIDGVHAKTHEQAQGRPVSEYDRQFPFGMAGHGKPGIETRLLGAGLAFFLKTDTAVRRSVAHAREDVDDGP